MNHLLDEEFAAKEGKQLLKVNNAHLCKIRKNVNTKILMNKNTSDINFTNKSGELNDEKLLNSKATLET